MICDICQITLELSVRVPVPYLQYQPVEFRMAHFLTHSRHILNQTYKTTMTTNTEHTTVQLSEVVVNAADQSLVNNSTPPPTESILA
jgi:hypothetical protein